MNRGVAGMGTSFRKNMQIRKRLDGAFVLLLFIGGFAWAALQLKPDTFPHFYQEAFAPAVMRALGYDFVDPVDKAEIPGLAEFLEPRGAALSQTSALDPPATRAPSHFQTAHRYLLECAGLCWRVLGISWAHLWPLYGTLFGLTAFGAYLVCRTAVSPALAFVGSVVFCVSSPVATILPHLRDFSKAPFILVGVALSIFALQPRRGVVGCLGLSALSGAVLGVGLGFRMDLMALVPLAVALLLGFGAKRGVRGLPVRLGNCVAFLVAFVLTSWPILSEYRGGGNSFHVINLGLMSHFDQRLGVDAAETHELGHFYDDIFLLQLVNDHAQQRNGTVSQKLEVYNKAYSEAGRDYFLDVLRTFPADLMIRAIAAPLGAYGVWPSRSQPWIGVALSIAAIGVLVSRNMRTGLVALTVVAYLGALVFLQFDLRHYFYLAIVPIFGACVLLQAAANAVQSRKIGQIKVVGALTLDGTGNPTRFLRRGFAARLGLVALAFMGMGVLTVGLRWYQRHSVADLLDSLGGLTRLSCAFDRSFTGDSVVLSPVSEELARPIGCRLWLLELSLPLDREAPSLVDAIRVKIGCSEVEPFSVDQTRELFFSPVRVQAGEPFLRYVFFTLNSGCANPTLEIDLPYGNMVTAFCELDRAAAGELLVNARLPVPGSQAVPWQTLGRSAARSPVHVPQLCLRDRSKLDLTMWQPKGLASFEELPGEDMASEFKVVRTVVIGEPGERILQSPAESVAPGLNRVTVVAKAGTVHRIQLAGNGSEGFFANFDVNAGIVTRRGSDTPSASIEPLGGGWFRLTADFWWRWRRENLHIRQVAVIDGPRDSRRSSSSCEGYFYLAIPRHFPSSLPCR